MTDAPAQTDSMFPRLDDAQIERLASIGARRHVEPGEIVFDLGSEDHGMFIVLQGSIEIVSVSHGEEAVLRVLERGQFTGEVNQLSGRRSLVRCRAREASELLELGRTCLREIMQTDVALGEMFLRAFALY